MRRFDSGVGGKIKKTHKMGMNEEKDKYKTLYEALGGKGESFSQLFWHIVQTEGTAYFEKYIEIFPDLSKDELRFGWQFYYADREEKKQDYTSDSLAKLCAKLSLLRGGRTVWDICAGSGALIIGAWNTRKDIFAVCSEMDEGVFPLLLFNLAVRNIPAYVLREDVLQGHIFESWSIAKGEKFGIITKNMFPEPYQGHIDCAISNPPFNLRVDGVSQNFTFVAKGLEYAQRMAIILPTGVLTHSAERDFRKKHIEDGSLEAVISLPGGFFQSTGVAVSFLIFDKNHKTTDGVFLVDVPEDYVDKETRYMRGEGDACHTNRVYKKTIKTVNDQKIDALCAMTFTETDLSLKVSADKIRECEYSLLIGKYKPVTLDEAHTKHRDFNDIVNDINKITRLKNTIKISINKTWAAQLGCDIMEDVEKDKKIIEEINGYLESLGIAKKLIEPDFYSLSASKILEIRQNDKEILSPVIETFIPLWQQHIRSMNKLENLLFAEFRDALLPALLYGRIELDKK